MWAKKVCPGLFAVVISILSKLVVRKTRENKGLSRHRLPVSVRRRRKSEQEAEQELKQKLWRKAAHWLTLACQPAFLMLTGV